MVPLRQVAEIVASTSPQIIKRQELQRRVGLYANVEVYAGVVMKLAGLDPSMFTPTFCVARVVGWTANVLEQSRDPKIIRPAARYVGPPPPQPKLQGIRLDVVQRVPDGADCDNRGAQGRDRHARGSRREPGEQGRDARQERG